MAGRPLRRARRNNFHEEEAELARMQANYAKRKRLAAQMYAEALRTDLNPNASSDDIRYARVMMQQLEDEFGFNARAFIAASRVNAGLRRTIRRNRDEMEFERFIAETGGIPV